MHFNCIIIIFDHFVQQSSEAYLKIKISEMVNDKTNPNYFDHLRNDLTLP